MGRRLESRRAKHALAAVADRCPDGRGAECLRRGPAVGSPQLTLLRSRIQPGGTIEATAERCTKEGGREVHDQAGNCCRTTRASSRETAGPPAGGRRTPRSTSSGLDVILTSEFANAGWIEPWHGKEKEEASKKRSSKSVLAHGEPSRTNFTPSAVQTPNTQLLWYRKGPGPEAAGKPGRK